MFKSSYKLCTLFGIPVYLDLSLIVLMLWYIHDYGNPFNGLAAGALLLVAITLHELGHSLVAKAFGCRVRDITLMIIGGRASLESMPRKHWQELLVAAAGPAVSLALGLIGLYAPIVLCAAGVLSPTTRNFLIGAVGFVNLGLFAFNLLPAFPMDGGRILRAGLQMRTTRVRATWIASRVGRVLAGLMVFFAICNILNIRVPTFPGVFGQLVWYFLASGTFIQLLIGWMIFSAAEREYQIVLMEEGAGPRNPFAGFPFFGGTPNANPPPDDGQAVVSPPPYERRGTTRVDVRKGE